MQVNTYLCFKGDCEAAFEFYARCLDGQLGPMFRYGGSPMADTVPHDWQQKVMHGSVTVGTQVLMGCDVLPNQYEEPKGFSLIVHPKTVQEADVAFEKLATGGRVVVPLEETFWARRFGVLVDRFGIQWTINSGEAGQV